MHPFGATTLCPRCDKAVYHAEQVLGPGRKLYHKPCLACTLCNKRLDSMTLLEHNEQPFCKACHVRNFGTRDLRSANLPQAPRLSSASPPPARPAAIVDEEEEERRPVTSFKAPPPTTYMRPITQTATGTRYGAALGTVTTNSTGSPRKWGGTAPSCPRCNKSVYFAEQVKAVGKTYHKGCLRCTECNTSLDSGRLHDHEGTPFCGRCYNKLHGPQGGGYALLGKAGGG